MPEVPAFVVTQIPRNRTITLYNRALPYRPFTLKGKQRVELTWLPGYAEATATVLGPSVEPTQINGMWKVAFLENENLPAMVEDNGVGIYSVEQTIAAFNDLRREGLLLRVSWGNTIRKGFLTSFEVQFHTLMDAQWAMEFTWINEGEDQVPVVIPQTSSTQGAANQYERQLEQTTQTALDPPYGSPWDKRAEVEDVLNKLAQNVSAAKVVLSLQFGVAIRPLDANRRMLAVAESVIANNDALLARYYGEVPGASSMTPLPAQSAVQRFTAQINTRRVIGLSRAMRLTAIEQGLELSTQTTSQVLAVYKARAGDDLRRLSQRYYGTEREWRRILTFNLLNSSLLAAGQLVLIPKLSELNADQVQ